MQILYHLHPALSYSLTGLNLHETADLAAKFEFVVHKQSLMLLRAAYAAEDTTAHELQDPEKGGEVGVCGDL